MGAISWSKFRSVLKKLNPKVKIIWTLHPCAEMIGWYGPRVHDSTTYGMNELCGLPSPRFFINFPKYDFLDEDGRVHRGYTSIFKILVRAKLIDKARLLKLLPTALAPSSRRPKPHNYEVDDEPEIPMHPLEPVPVGWKPSSSKIFY